MPPVFRLALSPNGYLHLGHAYSAMLNFEMARQSGGRFLLRIEDIDLDRSRAVFESAVYEDLAWLGLTWEEPVRRQSEQFLVFRFRQQWIAANVRRRKFDFAGDDHRCLIRRKLLV